MTTNTFNELKKKSYEKPVFLVMIDGKNIVIDNLQDLGFKDSTLGKYLEQLEKVLNGKTLKDLNYPETLLVRDIVENFAKIIKRRETRDERRKIFIIFVV